MIFLKSRSILQNTAFLTLANLVLRLVSLLYQIYLAEIIGAAGMGKLQLVLTAAGFAMTLGSAGVRVASMNLTAQEWGKGSPAGMKKAISCCLVYSLLFSTLSGALLWALTPKIAADFVKDSAVIPSLGILALTMPINCLTAMLSGYFTARGKIRNLVTIEIVERVLSIGITLVLLKHWANGNLSRVCCSVVGGSAVSTVMGLAAMLALLTKDLRPIPSQEIPMTKRLLSLCIPLALSDYLRSGLSTVEQFLIPRGLSKSSGNYDRSMADYGTISGMVFPVLMFPAAVFFALSDLLVPELSRCRVQGQHARIRRIVSRSLKAGAVFSSFAAGLMFTLAPTLGELLYHSPSAGAYLRLFSPLIVMLYIDALTDGMLKGLGEQVASVRYNTITAALDVLFLWILLPRWGLGGFFFTFAVTHAINFILSLRRLSKVTGFLPNTVHTCKTVVTAGISAAVVSKMVSQRVSVLSILFSAIIFSAIFFAAANITGILSKSDIQHLLPQRKTALS